MTVTPELHRARVSRRAAHSHPELIWNAFVDLLMSVRIDELTWVQQVASRAFMFDQQIQNGGYARFFSNHGLEGVEPAATALERLGAEAQAELLREAATRAQAREPLPTPEAYPYPPPTRHGEFLDLDSIYAQCEPSVLTLLETYLRKHLGEFIEFQEEL